MRHELCAVAVAVMLAGSAALGHAQIPAPPPDEQVNLTQAQELTILLRVENEQPQAGPAEVGATIPDGVKLKRLPSDVGAQIPEAERFQYAKVDDKVVLVDPDNKQVVKVIRPQAPSGGTTLGTGSTTGSGR